MTDTPNPVVLLARITVKQGMINEYLSIAAKAGKAVEKTEEGMFLHNFDLEPNDPHKYVWTKVYRISENFLFQVDNPLVQDCIKKHSNLATHFSIEILGNASQAVIDKIKSLGIPLKHFATTSVEYVRTERFS